MYMCKCVHVHVCACACVCICVYVCVCIIYTYMYTGYYANTTTGHGADVKCVDWHPRKNLLVSGSKDNQQPIKLWDPKAGQSVSTM